MPEAYRTRVQAAQLGGGRNEIDDFLDGYARMCSRKGVARGKATGEDRVQVKRLLGQYDVPTLLRLADTFLSDELADPLRGRYQHHMRLFAHHLPQLRVPMTGEIDNA